ncbi:uncharacterized protein B0H18DRAFT_983177 [Fomitopsis serialis]|uniref:uncharacterized protein n=1 Tax=Fomitopsis serialis TaxID=139415 RepID=UPI002007240F|nr:uncharacterized protein B0H18DRAFT_983177 [Neoantrodia serialis]KAH9933347.1 hypothetical protein B0H18DRAFT_983177 [Neoantrodia serialis]
MAAALSHMLSGNGRVEDRPNVGSSRDRERHDSNRSQHQSPATLRTQPSFNASQASAPNTQTLTVESMLAAHANTRDPTRSALDTANAQLWKLIEKQRSGYGQLMKELERVRGEPAGENTDALLRSHRDKEKREGRETTLRSSSSQSQLRGNDGGSSSSYVADPRSHVLRKHSADTGAQPIFSSLRSHPSSRDKLGSHSRVPSALPSSLSTGLPRDVTPDGRPTDIQLRALLNNPVLGQWQSGYRPSLDTARPMGNRPPRDSSPARPSPHTSSPSTQHSSPDTPSNHSLSPYPNGGERYYANLSDSPMPSPGIGGLEMSSSSGHASPPSQLPFVPEAAESLRSRSGTPASSTGARSRSTTAVGDEAAPFLDMGDGDSLHSSQGRPSITENDMLRVSQPQASEQPRTPVSPFPIADIAPQMKFRALPLLASDLPHTEITVITSTIRPNDRGKEVVSFMVAVDPGMGKEPWRIEKLYSDVIALDARVRATLSKNVTKKLVTLPEGRMWRDHAPAKVDQRKSALQEYLRSLVALPVKNKDEIIAFFTCDIVREAQKPVSQPGYKEGYLTKRGKNFGGWKSRTLCSRALHWILRKRECPPLTRGGAHLGSITITGAQIGRQQKAPDRRDADEDNEYRHAFLIIEARRSPSGSTTRHVLCADSDEERDSWVEELVRYVTGAYSEDQVAIVQNGPSPIAVGSAASAQSRSSISTNAPSEFSTPNGRRDVGRGDVANGRMQTYAYESTPSPVKSMATPSPLERASIDVAPLSNSMPTTSPLISEDAEMPAPVSQRANSEMGHYADLRTPDQSRKNRRRMSINPNRAPVPERAPSIPERTPSPEKEAAMATTPKVDAHGKVKISGPMNGTPIPAGYKFGGKDEKPEPAPPSQSDRREKAKSRTFWGAFGRQHDKPAMPTFAPRAVFGVPLDESLDVAEIASLPAIVFRCIQYLEAKKADQEEGIYRLSGSSAVIKSLKDRFNVEADVDLLASDEYWDPHAIAGLLKTFLRELPASILTRDLHLRFLSVIDFVDPQERIRELSVLIASLPLANYSLLRALTAHLILIVQNAHVNKMTMRNVGIVFSPTLGIPAGVFSLMLGEFKRVFNVDGTLEDGTPAEEEEIVDRRNSRRYTDAAADQLLGLSGRALPENNGDTPLDDGEEASVIEDSTEGATENDADFVGSSAGSSSVNLPPGSGACLCIACRYQSRRAGWRPAPTRGLNITTSDRTNHRNPPIAGLPASPRPSPRAGGNGAPSPSVAVSSPLTPR